MEQRCLLPEGAFRSQNVNFRSWLSNDTGKCVGNIGLNRLPLRRPYVPSASELQPNDRANIAAKAVQVLFETERIGEQEALPICVGRIFADLPIRVPEDRAKGLLEFVADGVMNGLRALARQFIQFAIALVCTRRSMLSWWQSHDPGLSS